MIYNMDKGGKHGMMGASMRENISLERKKGWGCISGMMGLGMRVCGRKIRSRG